MRFGTVALLGRSNVGKSTLLNRLLGQDLAIVSRLPQTTREPLLGVVHHPEAQLAILDCPGIHQPKSELGRRMNAHAWEVVRAADVVVFMTDVQPLISGRRTRAPALSAEDAELLGKLQQHSTAKVLLLLNKIDLIRDKTKLLPLLTALSDAYPFAALVPLSLRRDDGLTRALAELIRLLPDAAPGYDEDMLTDRPLRHFAQEYIREQALEHTRGEVPHAVAVSIDEFEEHGGRVVVRATIHVEKPGQRKILIGQGGAAIARIRLGSEARLRGFLERPVRVELFVRVTPRWKNLPRQLAELGYAAASAGAATTRAPRAKGTSS